MSYTHLTPSCRGRIQALVDEGKPVREIADILGRDRTTIQRELNRNSTSRGYEAGKAQALYAERRLVCRPRKKLEHQPLRAYLFEQFQAGFTPEQISGRLVCTHGDSPRMQISHEAIYQGLYADERLHCLVSQLP